MKATRDTLLIVFLSLISIARLARCATTTILDDRDKETAELEALVRKEVLMSLQILGEDDVNSAESQLYNVGPQNRPIYEYENEDQGSSIYNQNPTKKLKRARNLNKTPEYSSTKSNEYSDYQYNTPNPEVRIGGNSKTSRPTDGMPSPYGASATNTREPSSSAVSAMNTREPGDNAATVNLPSLGLGSLLNVGGGSGGGGGLTGGLGASSWCPANLIRRGIRRLGRLRNEFGVGNGLRYGLGGLGGGVAGLLGATGLQGLNLGWGGGNAGVGGAGSAGGGGGGGGGYYDNGLGGSVGLGGNGRQGYYGFGQSGLDGSIGLGGNGRPGYYGIGQNGLDGSISLADNGRPGYSVNGQNGLDGSIGLSGNGRPVYYANGQYGLPGNYDGSGIGGSWSDGVDGPNTYYDFGYGSPTPYNGGVGAGAGGSGGPISLNGPSNARGSGQASDGENPIQYELMFLKKPSDPSVNSQIQAILNENPEAKMTANPEANRDAPGGSGYRVNVPSSAGSTTESGRRRNDSNPGGVRQYRLVVLNKDSAGNGSGRSNGSGESGFQITNPITSTQITIPPTNLVGSVLSSAQGAGPGDESRNLGPPNESSSGKIIKIIKTS